LGWRRRRQRQGLHFEVLGAGAQGEGGQALAVAPSAITRRAARPGAARSTATSSAGDPAKSGTTAVSTGVYPARARVAWASVSPVTVE